mgnify:CR=1 FL=1
MGYKLSDQFIAEVAKALQLSLITQTDIVDHLRMLELEPVDGVLVLTEESVARCERNVNDLMEQGMKLAAERQS